jgi:hypothetical protein
MNASAKSRIVSVGAVAGIPGNLNELTYYVREAFSRLKRH